MLQICKMMFIYHVGVTVLIDAHFIRNTSKLLL